jgi:5-methylcytosine-specific restriction endonuclease McrA
MTPLSELLTHMEGELARASERLPVSRRGERQPISDHVRSLVLLRDRRTCVWCKATRRLVLDHIVPWSAGGSDDPTNLRVLCWDCNSARSNYRYVDMTPRAAVQP